MAEAPSEWTVLSMLEWATDYFEERGVNSPRFSIEWLLADVLGIRRLDLYMKYDRPLASGELAELRPMVKRRAAHEPLQYITGETDFYNCTIKVEPGVLIPRQETEQLVDIILNDYPEDRSLNAVDLGTGSGCIPVALKHERPAWQISATDISDDALNIARQNAALNNCDIQFIKDDLLKSGPGNFSEAFDLIVSNPPYILEEEKDSLDKEVRDYEPHLALFCRSTLEVYGAIEKFARKHLSDTGTLYLELHENYSPETEQIFRDKGWSVQPLKDYGNKDRFLRIKR